jgi:hypothetical protein
MVVSGSIKGVGGMQAALTGGGGVKAQIFFLGGLECLGVKGEMGRGSFPLGPSSPMQPSKCILLLN